MQRLYATGLILVCLFLVVFARLNTFAEGNDWMSSQNINFTQSKEFTNLVERPTATYGGNTDCSKRLVISRPEKSLAGATFQTPITHEDCMNDASYGEVGGSWLVRNGTGIAGPLNLGNPKQFIIGGPNLTTGIIGDATAPVGVYVDFALNFESQLKTDVLSDGSVRHSIKNPGEIKQLKDARGVRLMMQLDTLAFTSNGDFAVFDSPSYGLVRLDTRTGNLLSFGQPTSYNNGSNPGYQLAISADGRFVVESGSNLFRIFDLENCVGMSAEYGYLSSCPSRSLEEMRINSANFGRWPAYIRFINSEVIRYYAAQAQGPQIVYRQYDVSLDGAQANPFDYLALGDSYASGEGALNYKADTNHDPNRCHTSLHSYGMLIGARLNYENYNTVACSGARTFDVVSEKTESYKGQFKDGLIQEERNLSDYLPSFTPGKITQNTFVEHYNPEAVTISIGGNDLGFADKLKHCIIGVIPSMTCFDSEDERRGIATEVYNLVPDLVTTYQALRAQDRRVYVLGYPKIVAPNGNCAVNVRLNADEIALADRLTTLLNDAIEFAAGQAGVQYVDVENLLNGRRLCEVPSEQALIHGLSQFVGDGKRGSYAVAQESFHPKADAQKLYRDAILSQTNNLSRPMPLPKTPALFPRLLNGDAFFEGGEITPGTPEYIPKYEDLLRTRVPKGTNWPLELDQRTSGLAELSTVRVELHSEPVVLGEYTTDLEGNLSTEIVIPATTKPGFHSIHIYGTTLAGEKIDFYDYLLIGENTADLDGDGMPDKFEGCIFDEPSGIDTDQDFTDDACDIANTWTDESVQPGSDGNESEDVTDGTGGDGAVQESAGDNEQGSSTQTGGAPETEVDQDTEPLNTVNSISSGSIIGSVSVETMLPIITIPAQSLPTLPVVAVINTVAMAEPSISNGGGNSLQPSDSPDTSTQSNPEVKQAEDSLKNTPASKPGQSSTQQAVNNQKVYLYYLAGGVVAFILLVGGILYLRRL